MVPMKAYSLRTGQWLAVLCLVVGAGTGQAADKKAKTDAQEASELIEHGSYIANRVAMCVQCHSGRESSGDLAEHRLFKGATMPLNSPFQYQVWAIAAPPIIGLPTGYTEQDLVNLLTNGKARTGRIPLHPMPPYRFKEYDARAVAAYLKWAGTQTEATDVTAQEKVQDQRAMATMTPVGEGQVSGSVEFTRQNGVTIIRAQLAGLKPGLHGFHIMKADRCDASGKSDPGEHFNPGNQPHGAPSVEKRHAGDLGNIVADENGFARYERVDAMVELDGDNSIVGHIIVVTEHPDDLVTQPDGNSGAELSCGVIRKL